MTARLEPIVQTAEQWAHAKGGWPWHVVGVFPTQADVEEDEAYIGTGFCYTVGLDPTFEVWCPARSVEGRGLDLQILATLLNGIAFATRDHVLNPGDDVLVGLGIPDAQGEWDHDADAVFWIGELEPKGRRQTFQSPAPFTLPVRWSSPLGWRED